MKKENILLTIICVGVLALCIWGLKALDQDTKNRAIERCGSENNLVERYTKEGDLYYTCKVEKN